MKSSSLWIILHRMRIPFIVIVVTYTIAIIGLILIQGQDSDGNPYNMGIFDAFYFVTYTATTIGFGETPYEFTYAQRLWVTFSIYLTVLGWFYGIGTVVSLLQDKLLIKELKRNSFRRSVKHIREKFIIILGYNSITSAIIKKALEYDIRTVIIEEDESKVNELMLENYTPHVPVLHADARATSSLKDAGIDKFHCKAIVSLFSDDRKNLKVTILSKLLNKNITLAIKASSVHQSETLQDLGVDIITNPFAIISKEIDIAFKAPNILKLEKWIYKLDDLNAISPKFPIGKYIICGFGRMGKYLYNRLLDNGIELVFIEVDKNKIELLNEQECSKLIIGDADDKEILLKADVKNAVAIIAATDDDTTNLSILNTAKKLNKDIMSIARENNFDDFSIFSNAKINHIFVPANILIHKTTNALINPLSDIFIYELIKQDEVWASKLVRNLIQTIDEDPLLYELDITKTDATELFYHLKFKKDLNLDILKVSLHNRELNNNVVPLLLLRGDEKILLPSWNTKIKLNDKILFACDKHAKNDMEYICQNRYEFHYALNGYEKSTIIKRIFK